MQPQSLLPCVQKMKLSTFGTLFALATASVAVPDVRQQQCSAEDACYSAVYGDGSFSHMVQAVRGCENFLTTSVFWYPMYVARSLRVFFFFNITN